MKANRPSPRTITSPDRASRRLTTAPSSPSTPSSKKKGGRKAGITPPASSPGGGLTSKSPRSAKKAVSRLHAGLHTSPKASPTAKSAGRRLPKQKQRQTLSMQTAQVCAWQSLPIVATLYMDALLTAAT